MTGIYDRILKNEEKIVYDLRELYRRYGYTQFKMGKFEEYTLYAQNKDFLVSDGILTFTNTDGKLMALKPDVTLSIAKNSVDIPGFVQKMYYNENVYRISKDSHEFREIMQTGVECMGDVGDYDVCESIILAAKSLELISSDYILDISHMGLVQGFEKMLNLSVEDEKALLTCIGEKNMHEALAICFRRGISEELGQQLHTLISTYGEMESVLDKISGLVMNSDMEKAVKELILIKNVLEKEGLDKKVRFDFSIVSDMGYYNGVVFQGFVNGLPSCVLSGGKYDNLMAKMGKKGGAIGFAVYLDMLEILGREERKFDVDVVLLYDSSTSIEKINNAVKGFASEELSVSVQKKVPENLRYRKLAKICGGEVRIIETND